ncbi:MAG TPA: response regulator [Vicinamibacterales bacterium]|jgi:CheY-like chemotaxis protein
MAQTLLLADASPAIHRLLELTFDGKPIQVVAVPDGASVLARLESDPPDIILADIAMPAPTGYDIAAHVKRTPALSRIPVVLLTGAFEPADPARAHACGCDGVLAKPFDPEIVLSRVIELLAGAGRSSVQQGEPAGAAPGSRPEGETAKPADLDSYFERLDESLTALSLSPPPAPETPLPRLPDAPASGWGSESRTEETIAAQIDPALVRDIVERVAERLIRAEIERIKAEIREE